VETDNDSLDGITTLLFRFINPDAETLLIFIEPDVSPVPRLIEPLVELF